ncbi:MAG: chromosome segregation protein SMC, partial [Candidatus Promineifilaceae bacterium]
LAERTYTIIGQGLVDQALSLRAEERRALFEEAAGVSHYKTQRAEAIRRLQETERNLERVHDILAELKPRVGHLRRQAERAQNYDQIAADLRHHLRVWYGYHWRIGRDALRQSKLTSDRAQQGWLQAREEQQRIHELYDRERDQVRQLQAKLRTLRDEREELRGQVEKALRQLAVLEERHKLLGGQLSEIELEMPILRSEQLTAQQELKQALEELSAADEVLAAKRADLAKHQSSFDSKRQELDQLQKLVEDLENQQRFNQRASAQAQGQLIQLRQQVEELAAKSTESADLLETDVLVANAREAVALAERGVAAARADRHALDEERQESASALAELQAAARRNEALVNARQKERAQLETKREMLGRLRRVDVEMPDTTGLAGRLLHVLSIPEVYQTAAEAALLDRLNTLLVNNSTSLWQLLQNNRDKRLLVASVPDLRPPTPLPLPEHPAAIGWLSELVRFEEIAEPLVQLLLGRVLLVEDAAAAFELAHTLPEGCTTVTSDGFLAYAGGLVETRPAQDQNGILAREQEWRQVEKQIEQLTADVNRHQQALEACLADQAKVRREVDRLTVRAAELGEVEAEAARVLGESQRELDRTAQRREFLVREQGAAVETRERLSREIVALEETIQKHEAAADRLRSQLADAKDELVELPVNEAQGQVVAIQDQVDSARTIRAGRQAVVDSRRATLSQVEDRLQRLADRQSRLKSEYQPQDLAIFQERSAGLKKQLDFLDEELRPLQQELRLKQEQLGQLEKVEVELQRRAHDLETHYTQARIELSQRENQVEGLKERVRSDLGLVVFDYDDDEPGQSPLPIAEVIEYLPQVETLPEDTENSIQLLRGQLNRMGGVNPEAPLEYEETRTRFDFLTQQVNDLSLTQDKLRRVIDELDQLTSRAFVETVDKVDVIFGDVFRRLFGGGSAQLVLTDPDDLTLTGVDIVARLPRRREQSLALLSGGERSLTAAALIFALLKVAPTPFCVLDEVDAMLDEANVTRFREMLQELSAQTQIIVITHNRGTVEAARTVYGVSMGADSASQVLSIRPEAYLQRRIEQ